MWEVSGIDLKSLYPSSGYFYSLSPKKIGLPVGHTPAPFFLSGWEITNTEVDRVPNEAG
jgi:hypothetical protein